MAPNEQRNQPTGGVSLYSAPAAMAFFAVTLVLSLVDRHLVLDCSDPTWKGFLTSHLWHADGWHLTATVCVVLVAGGVLESRWGTLRFVAFYLTCVWGGSLLSIGISQASGVAFVSCGASAAGLGALIAVALFYPDHRLLRSVPAVKYLVWVVVLLGGAGLVLLSQKTLTAADGPETLVQLNVLPQLVGVPLGLFFVWVGPMVARLIAYWHRRREVKRRRRLGQIRERVDELLEKISVEGSSSLTRDERAFLRRASKHYRRN